MGVAIAKTASNAIAMNCVSLVQYRTRFKSSAYVQQVHRAQCSSREAGNEQQKDGREGTRFKSD